MRDLTTFILGITFTLVGIPALQALGDIIATCAESIKARIAISIAKSDKKISEVSAPEGGGYAIGFHYEPSSEEEEYEDEEEESLD